MNDSSREVGVEGPELVGVQHPLVDDGPRREARHVEGVAPRERRSGDGLLGEAADDEELPLEGVARLRPLAAAHEQLPDDGLARAGRRAERRAVGRDVPPAEDPLPFRDDDLLQLPLADLAARRLHREEEHPEAVVARRRQPRCRLARAQRATNACGICVRSPAPSPVFFSLPVAPRCSRLQRTCSALRTMSWEGRAFTSTTKPKPQASCSLAGS